MHNAHHKSTGHVSYENNNYVYRIIFTFNVQTAFNTENNLWLVFFSDIERFLSTILFFKKRLFVIKKYPRVKAKPSLQDWGVKTAA